MHVCSTPQAMACTSRVCMYASCLVHTDYVHWLHTAMYTLGITTHKPCIPRGWVMYTSDYTYTHHVHCIVCRVIYFHVHPHLHFAAMYMCVCVCVKFFIPFSNSLYHNRKLSVFLNVFIYLFNFYLSYVIPIIPRLIELPWYQHVRYQLRLSLFF